jgi:hypothetical protein
MARLLRQSINIEQRTGPAAGLTGCGCWVPPSGSPSLSLRQEPDTDLINGISSRVFGWNHKRGIGIPMDELRQTWSVGPL